MLCFYCIYFSYINGRGRKREESSNQNTSNGPWVDGKKELQEPKYVAVFSITHLPSAHYIYFDIFDIYLFIYFFFFFLEGRTVVAKELHVTERDYLAYLNSIIKVVNSLLVFPFLFISLALSPLRFLTCIL